mgnify:FL=1
MTAAISIAYTGNFLTLTFRGCSLVLPGTDIRDPKASSFAGAGSNFSITPSTLSVQAPVAMPLANSQILVLIGWSPGQSPEVMLGSNG